MADGMCRPEWEGLPGQTLKCHLETLECWPFYPGPGKAVQEHNETKDNAYEMDKAARAYSRGIGRSA